jgi:hypothetical protein
MERKILFAGDACSEPPITIRFHNGDACSEPPITIRFHNGDACFKTLVTITFHNLHASDIRGILLDFTICMQVTLEGL